MYVHQCALPKNVYVDFYMSTYASTDDVYMFVSTSFRSYVDTRMNMIMCVCYISIYRYDPCAAKQKKNAERGPAFFFAGPSAARIFFCACGGENAFLDVFEAHRLLFLRFASCFRKLAFTCCRGGVGSKSFTKACLTLDSWF